MKQHEPPESSPATGPTNVSPGGSGPEGSRLIRFAHRGAPTRQHRENTLGAFAAALRAGAEGLESDVRLTLDGVPVLVHGTGRQRGRSIGNLRRTDLPRQIPSLADLWEHCGTDFELSLDMTDPGAVTAVVELAQRYDALPRLWLTYWHLPVLATWRGRWPELHLVYATLFGFPRTVLERTVRRAADAGVDAINVHHRLIGRLSAPTAHAGGVKLFAWGLHGSAHVRRAAALGVDGAFVDQLGSP